MTALPPLRRDVMVRTEDKDHFAVDVASGQIYELNETAAFVLRSWKSGITAEELIELMMVRYEGVPPAQITTDLDALARQFDASGFFQSGAT